MPLTMSDLTVHLSDADQAGLLEDWRWLVAAHRLPVLVTALGHVFLHDQEDGTMHLLDADAGTLDCVAGSADEFRAGLAEREFVMAYFPVGEVSGLQEAGRALAAGQVWSYATPLVLGGERLPDNLQATSLLAHFSTLGMIHEQVRHLPAGTRIADVSLG